MFSKKIKKQIIIEGMGCKQCAMKIEKALDNLESITKTKVNINKKEAIVTLKKDININILKEVVENLEYKVIDIKNL